MKKYRWQITSRRLKSQHMAYENYNCSKQYLEKGKINTTVATYSGVDFWYNQEHISDVFSKGRGRSIVVISPVVVR